MDSGDITAIMRRVREFDPTPGMRIVMAEEALLEARAHTRVAPLGDDCAPWELVPPTWYANASYTRCPIGAEPDEVIFTGGGSEANNQALKGVVFAKLHGIFGRWAKGAHIITSAVEHPATLQPCAFLKRLGCRVTVLPVDRHGLVDPEAVRKAFRVAKAQKPGPTHLELPEDVMEAPLDAVPLPVRHDIRRPMPSEAELERAAEPVSDTHMTLPTIYSV